VPAVKLVRLRDISDEQVDAVIFKGSLDSAQQFGVVVMYGAVAGLARRSNPNCLVASS
jgi:hypothetical protein